MDFISKKQRYVPLKAVPYIFFVFVCGPSLLPREVFPKFWVKSKIWGKLLWGVRKRRKKKKKKKKLTVAALR